MCFLGKLTVYGKVPKQSARVHQCMKCTAETQKHQLCRQTRTTERARVINVRESLLFPESVVPKRPQEPERLDQFFFQAVFQIRQLSRGSKTIPMDVPDNKLNGHKPIHVDPDEIRYMDEPHKEGAQEEPGGGGGEEEEEPPQQRYESLRRGADGKLEETENLDNERLQVSGTISISCISGRLVALVTNCTHFNSVNFEVKTVIFAEKLEKVLHDRVGPCALHPEAMCARKLSIKLTSPDCHTHTKDLFMSFWPHCTLCFVVCCATNLCSLQMCEDDSALERFTSVESGALASESDNLELDDNDEYLDPIQPQYTEIVDLDIVTELSPSGSQVIKQRQHIVRVPFLRYIWTPGTCILQGSVVSTAVLDLQDVWVT